MAIKQLILLVFLAPISALWAQNTYNMTNTTINACNGSFFDPGGNNGDYGNNLNITTTICAGGAGGGTHIRLDFSGVQLAAGDLLCFYDGTSTSAPLLSCSDQYPAGTPIVVQATAANTSGCLTLNFTTNSTGTAPGWSAVISCIKSCQIVQAKLVSTLPLISPVDTGWIDICPGKRVTFTGEGVYPQNNLVYAQSDFTTEFEWSFGDGDIAYGPLVSHVFDQPGGYYVQLALKDAIGCPSTNLISQRIRVSPRPDFSIVTPYPATICSGDTLNLSAAVVVNTGSNNLGITPGTGAFSVAGIRADSLALPDGTGIPFSTSLNFTAFSPGQVLTDIDDLEGICINMEHSWARDIEIKITCPNGTEVTLHNHVGQTGSEVYLGVPNDSDDFFPIPGAGRDYCWTPNATNPYWIQYFNTSLGGSGTLPSANYRSFETLNNLIGCPLNGEWTITVTDLWPADNGYIFSWGIDFNDALYPDVETFSPNIQSWQWKNQSNIFYYSTDSIAASPQNAGTAAYIFTATDSYGCNWDTTLKVTVLPFTHPNCFSCNDNYSVLRDTTVCTGAPVQLNGASLTGTTQEVRFESVPDYKFGASNHPHSNPYISPVSVSSLGYTLLTNPITQIKSVCMDINTDFDADLFIFLRSPDNKQIELSTGNGGSGDNYKVTCFTPTATNPINMGTAPFNGNYAPEGSWSALNNAVVNGDWKLIVSDGFGQNQLGTLNNWTIGFNIPNTVNYTWNNTVGLSCTTCPNPIATPNAPTTYILTANDNFNCTHKDTVVITPQNFFPAPTGLLVTNMDNGMMTWTWNPLSGVAEYEVNINNTGWISVNTTTYTVNGLIPGNNVTIAVRAKSSSVACPPNQVTGSQTFIDCTLELTLVNTTPCSCFGATDGAVNITPMGGQGQTIFYSSFGPATPYTNGNLTFFPAGNHFAFAVDAAGCRDTSFFTITQPSQIIINLTPTVVSCFGGTTGSISATATGGTGNLSYAWSTCTGSNPGFGQQYLSLPVGCYRITVSDQVGCSSTTTQNLTQNPAISLTAVQDSTSCFGVPDGTATVTVNGGLMPYSYAWDNGDLTATADNLTPGFHSVTITDAANCNATTLIDVKQPAQMVVDSIVAAPETCKDKANGLITVYTKGGTKPYSYQWTGTNQTTQTAINLPAGAYTVTIRDKNGCTVTAQALVASPSALVATSNNITPERCAGKCDGSASLQINGGTTPYSIDWNTAGIPDNILTYNALCGGNYQISITDKNACTAQIAFTIAPATVLNIALTADAPSCPGIFDGSLTSAVSGGVLPYSYLWSNGQTTANASSLTCNTYTVTITDANNCTISAAQLLDCPDAIAISAISANAVKCFGQSNGSATVTATGGSGIYTYVWSSSPAQTTPTANNLPQALYTVTVTDTQGCSITGTASVTSPASLSATNILVPVDCFGGTTGSASVSPSGGTTPYKYLWNTTATTSSIDQMPAGNYTVTITDNNNCSLVIAPLNIIQPASALSVNAVQTQKSCFGVPAGIATATANGGNGLPYTYFWSNNTTTAIANALANGNYTVTATDKKGCTATSSVTIEQFDSIRANILLIPPTCFGDNDGQAAVNLVQGGAGNGQISNYNLQWGGLPGAPTGEYWGNLPGAKPFSLTISDQQNCSRVYNLELSQPTKVVPLFSLKNIQCNGAKNGSITINSHLGDNPLSNFVWNNGGSTNSITDLAPGTYTVQVTDTKGCTGNGAASLTEPDPLELSFERVQIRCFSDQNGAITVKANGGIPTYTYQWSNGQTTFTNTGLGKGQYTLTLTDANGCTKVDSTRIDEPVAPEITAITKDAKCYNAPNGRIELNINGGTAPYRYRINNQPFNGSPIFLGVSAGTYIMQIIDRDNCIYSKEVTINQPGPLTVAINPNETEITYGEDITLVATSTNNVGIVQYEWSFELLDSFICETGAECAVITVQKPSFANIITVFATDQNGCAAESTARIKVKKPRDVYVPTGFTPNNDGNNDILQVFGKSKQIKTIKSFQIFDRWGELIYQDKDFPANDLTRGWDGTFRDKACEVGVYIWTMEVEYLDGYESSFYGETTLIR
jgi:gliding motility-associated-like protein